MVKIVLIKPNKEYEQQAKEFIREFIDKKSQINGTGSLEKYIDKYDEWLRIIEIFEREINLKEGYVPASTYFAIREEDNIIVGMTNIRHRLTDELLMHGGHIGYCVRPTERKKGYATDILCLAIEKCNKLGIEKVLVTCDKNNIGSAKAIQNNFAVLENEIMDDDILYQRYWIDVKYVIENKYR